MAGIQDFKSEDVSGLVDHGRLAAWMDTENLGAGRALRIDRVSGGMSNETLGLQRGQERWALRRPAKLALVGADKGMEREFRVLSALEGTPVPHPKPVALCRDPSVAGCTFYVMEWIDGFPAGLAMPQRFAEDRGMRREIAMSAARTLGELARLDWKACGLGDFGKPADFHERQVARWTKQLDGYPAWPERDLSMLTTVGLWLDAARPASADWSPGIMHGDYHLANLMVAPEPPGRVAAILDWENATIGDPLLDLAGFLRLIESPEQPEWADREELIGCWERSSGRVAPDLRYYTVLSAFKLSVMLEGIFRRSAVDPTRTRAEAMGEMALQIMHEATHAIDA